MPAFNAASTIQSSVDSVLQQTFANWELIIINDASIDKTGSIIEQYVSLDNRIKHIKHEFNRGLPAARNTGIDNAKGQFIAFLDSDDEWYPNKLEIQFGYHKKHKDVKISHSAFDIFNDNGIVKRPFKKIAEFNSKKQGNILPSLYSKNTIGVLTVMAERQSIKDVGGFDTGLWTMEDQDLWIRLALANQTFGYINQSLAKYRINPTGITNKIGKYKNAYKVFINKYKSATIANKSYNQVLANYYRYFAIAYKRKGEDKLAMLYIKNALKTEKFILQNILNFAFMVNLAIIKFLKKIW